MLVAEIDFYSLVVFAHVMAAIAGLGFTFLYPVLWGIAHSRYPRSVPYLLSSQASIGPRVIGPSLLLLIATGLCMVITEDGGFGFDVLFVQVGLPIAVVLLLAGPLYFGPTEEGLAEIAERDLAAAGDGEVAFSEEFERAYRRLRAGGLIATVLIVTAVFFMTVKP
jgi:hypothetical protein